MTSPIISVSGLRGIVGESLSPGVAVRFAAAFAAEAAPGPILLSGDGRSHGPIFADAVRAALCAAGRRVIDAGVCATPTCGVLVRQHQCAGAVQITASHNPPQYNGLKLLNKQGQFVSPEYGARVLDRYQAGEIPWAAFDGVGAVERLEDSISGHLALVLATVQVDPIRDRKFKVLLDSNHGSGGRLGRKLLEELGCEVVAVGAAADGQFEHPPEPIAENLVGVSQQVLDAEADVGFCQDPDADRLAIIDEAGRFLGEEYTLGICLDHVLQYRKGVVVTNCATSRMCQDIAEARGSTLVRSKVGEAYVVAEMKKQKAVFGGEGNGGPIDPRVGYIRDSFVGMAQTLEVMATREQTVSELVAGLPGYVICKTKIGLEKQRLDEAYGKLENHFGDAGASRLDGLRLDWSDRWLLVRGSNTEPIVRIIAEAPTAATAEAMCEEAKGVIG